MSDQGQGDTLLDLEPEIRRSLIDGLTRFGPLPLLLGTALVSAWVMAFGASRFLAGVVCVFEMPRAIQTHPDGCVSLLISGTDLGRLFAGALVFSLIYLGLHRLSIGRRWFLEYDDRLQLHPAHVFALVAGPVLGSDFIADLAAFSPRGLLQSAGVLKLATGPMMALILGSARALAIWAVAKYAREAAVTCALRQHLAHRLRAGVGNRLRVHVTTGHATITGPIDEIDEGRIHDIVAMDFNRWIDKVAVETTLPPEQYLRYRGAVLGPSGYKGKPIRPAREFSPAWVLAALLAGLLFLGLMMYHGGVLTWEEFSDQAKDALTDMRPRVPQLPDPGAEAPEESDAPDPEAAPAE